MLDAVCKSRGFLLRGGVYDTERAARVLLDEFRGGKIARVTLELPPEPDASVENETAVSDMEKAAESDAHKAEGEAHGTEE